MNKYSDYALTLLSWVIGILLMASAFCNVGIWWFIGRAFWFHDAGQLWYSLWFFLGSLPASIARVVSEREKRKKKMWY